MVAAHNQIFKFMPPLRYFAFTSFAILDLRICLNIRCLATDRGRTCKTEMDSPLSMEFISIFISIYEIHFARTRTTNTKSEIQQHIKRTVCPNLEYSTDVRRNLNSKRDVHSEFAFGSCVCVFACVFEKSSQLHVKRNNSSGLLLHYAFDDDVTDDVMWVCDVCSLVWVPSTARNITSSVCLLLLLLLPNTCAINKEWI